MKYHLVTFGCQMNKNDSERIAGLLDSLAYEETADPAAADFLLVNTCSVRQMAEDRVTGIIRKWREIKKKNPRVIIGVTGCLPGRDHDGKLKKKFPDVDLFFPINDLVKLPEWLGGLKSELNDYLAIPPKYSEPHRAFVSIQTGCDNFCSYCVVPRARGRERNRPVGDILREARALAAGGCLEIQLLGQVVNNYRAPDPENFSTDNPFVNRDDFSALLWEANQIDGLARIHFTAAHPQYVNKHQIRALALPRQVNYWHLPAQSGDNEILKKMNRHYTREEYLAIIARARAVRPGLAIGTDLIVGFAGETEAQFQKTLDFFRAADFDIAYTAIYSPRSGTYAAEHYADDVPWEIKKERWHRLQRLMEEIAREKNQKYAGQTVEVLVDNCVDGLCSGNSREMKLTQFLGNEGLVGKIVTVEIFAAFEWLLKGKLCEKK